MSLDEFDIRNNWTSFRPYIHGFPPSETDDEHNVDITSKFVPDGMTVRYAFVTPYIASIVAEARQKSLDESFEFISIDDL